eukprot:c2568_g1_i1.p1 GENE.c2568_g1_i1~~c2568_g1_i1.p1  ORF type:complete len:640 (-),score=181.92 c2568_g1_i1:93-2012(-)
MTKFGELITDKIRPGWEGYYVDYESLKKMLYVISSAPPLEHAKGGYQFKKAVEQQLGQVNQFFDERLTKLEESLNPSHAKPASLAKDGWAVTADERAKDVIELEEYAYLNYEAFRKILKKHDKMLNANLLHSFMIDLDHNEASFWKKSRRLRQCVDGVSGLYGRGGRYDNLAVVSLEGPQAVGELHDFSEGGVKKSFVRKNHKYWLPRHKLLHLLVRLSAQLPLYYFSNNAEDTQTTSVYLDNDNCDMYARRLRREDGATLIRYRVYGPNRPSHDGTCFVERKTHHEKIYGGTSKKERYQISEGDVGAAIGGEHVTLINAGKSDEQLQQEVTDEITAKQLRPFTTTKYRRTVFQIPTDDRLRISVDSGLAFTKEFDIQDWNWHKHLGRVPAPDEYYEFPYAVLELKLRDVEMPAWFGALIDGNLVTEVPKFSKFLHSVVTFRRSQVPELPYWIEENPADFGFLFANATSGPNVGADHSIETANASNKNNNNDAAVAGGSWFSRMFPNRYSKFGQKQVSGGGRPMKLDPKAFMANERTLLNWNQQAITLCTFGVALLSITSKPGASLAGLMMVLTGILLLIYSQAQYIRRWNLLRNRASGLAFMDAFGPLLLTIFLVLTFSLAVIFEAAPPTTGGNIMGN